MEPIWHQDEKSIQPKHLPHFEVVGPQLDAEHRREAARLVASASGVLVVGLLILIAIFALPTAWVAHKSQFGQFREPEATQPFKDKIIIKIHSRTREESVPGKLFTTTRAQEGFVFVVCDLTVINRAPDKFNINPYSFGMYTNDGTLYRTDLSTNYHPDGLRAGNIDSKERKRGIVVFKIPRSKTGESLELMGANGTISTAQF